MQQNKHYVTFLYKSYDGLVELSNVLIKNTLFTVGSFDPGGFATGMITVFYTFLFVINGLTIVIIGLFTKYKEI
jgi:hypothetical protein